ncbi:MAG: hypothetical protein CMJ18_12490 [Phycisphaeraceae bacterium]|nr:hypothetical protein [Phycisphaeraceae bacterium]
MRAHPACAARGKDGARLPTRVAHEPRRRTSDSADADPRQRPHHRRRGGPRAGRGTRRPRRAAAGDRAGSAGHAGRAGSRPHRRIDHASLAARRARSPRVARRPADGLGVMGPGTRQSVRQRA